MITVSSPAVSATAFTRGAVVTPIDELNDPLIFTLRASTTPALPMKPARDVYPPSAVPTGTSRMRSAAPAVSAPADTVPPAPAVVGTASYVQRSVVTPVVGVGASS